MAKKYVLGMLVTNRIENALQVQKVLTECGCNIKTRIGLHEADENVCSPNGLILIELFGDDSACVEVERKLREIKGLQVRTMVFDA